MEPGYLVEFFEEKRLLCGVVLELKGERLRVLTQTNRELTLAPKRVLHACPSPLNPNLSRQQLLAHLEETARKREELQAAINLEELWELLAQEDQSLALEDMADLWFGRAAPDQVAALGRSLRGERFLFKYKEGRWVPNPPEVVAQLQEQHSRELERHQELEEAAAWLQAVWEEKEVAAPPAGARLVEVLRQMAVWGDQAPDYPQGKACLEKARLTAPDAAFRLLVKLKVFQEDEDLDLYRLEVPRQFSPEALSLSARLRQSPLLDPYAACRQDLTFLDCLTIDGERTRDFDDALSLEEVPAGWRLGVHIADVSALVRPDTVLDLEAQERGTSIYLPDRRLPMLPEDISEDSLSLLAHQERLALSFLVTLSPEGEVREWALCPSRITVQQRLTYQEVDQLLPQDQKLATLARLAQSLKEQRQAQGGYELQLPEVWVSFNHQGGLQVTVEDQKTPSHQLVGEAMVLANSLAARFLKEQGIPAIYRSQPKPREPIHREEPKGLLELWQDRRRLSRVVTDLTPQPHWGLGLPQYTMASSPIRRYLDLVSHRQILAALSDTPLPYSRPDLEKILMTIEPAMRRGGLLKARRLRYWLLKYMAGRAGEKMEALVLEALPHRYRLMFPQLLLEVFLPAPASLRLTPGDNLMVRLERVLPREDQVKLSLA